MIDETKDVGAVHAAMTKELGRPPTMHELALRMNTTQHMIRCFVLDDNLPITKMSKSEAATLARQRREEKERRALAEKRKQAKREKTDVKAWRIEPLRRDMIRPLILRRNGGLLPGWEYDPHRVVFAHCAKCGRRILVRPRTHPWWIDRGGGEMSPTCGPVCSGVNSYTNWKMNV